MGSSRSISSHCDPKPSRQLTLRLTGLGTSLRRVTSLHASRMILSSKQSLVSG